MQNEADSRAHNIRSDNISPDNIQSDTPNIAGFAPVADGVRYLFIDFNAYFASVEQHDEPDLRGRPVIVTPLPSEHSGAIAASYEAKALGISRGTSVMDARKLCPDVAVRPARHDRYVEMHHVLLKEIERHIPVQRVCSIDECVCLLNPDEGDIPSAKAIALKIKQGLYDNVSPAIKCSIGIASSSLLAKLASDLKKPDGLTVINPAHLPGVLADLPIQAIPGVGSGVHRRLIKSGITSFTQLWGLAPKQARAIWGSVVGERFIYGLKGYGLPDAGTPDKRMIGHSRVLSGPHRRPEGARVVARALLLKAVSRLRYYNMYASGLHVSLKLYPEGGLSQDARFRGTQNSWVCLKQLDEMWYPMMHWLSQPKNRGKAVKLVSVHLFNLDTKAPERDLFVDASADERDAREAHLWRRIDMLNQKYGMHHVFLASQFGLDLNYLGVKIAFSRVPERSEFVHHSHAQQKRMTGAEHLRAKSANPARSFG